MLKYFTKIKNKEIFQKVRKEIIKLINKNKFH